MGLVGIVDAEIGGGWRFTFQRMEGLSNRSNMCTCVLIDSLLTDICLERFDKAHLHEVSRLQAQIILDEMASHNIQTHFGIIYWLMQRIYGG